ncbi:WD40 repeat domain-containing protein [Streptosporangium lutulentum]
MPRALTVAPSGRVLAIGGIDGVIRLWDPLSGQELGQPLVGHTSSIRSMSISPDSRTLLSTASDGTMRSWDIGVRQTTPHPVTDAVEDESGTITRVALDRSGRLLTASNESGAQLWDLTTSTRAGPRFPLKDIARIWLARRRITVRDRLGRRSTPPLGRPGPPHAGRPPHRPHQPRNARGLQRRWFSFRLCHL